MRKIKVIYVYAGFDWGMGGEQRILAIAKGLDRREFDFTICLIENARGGLGPTIAKLGWPISELNLSRRFYNPVNTTLVIFRLYDFFRRERPDVVHTQAVNANVLGRVAAKLAAVPVVVATHNAPGECEPRRCVRMLNLVVNGCLDGVSDGIVTASEKILRTKRWPTRPRECHVLSTPANFVETPEFSNLRNAPAWHGHSHPVVGVVGRLSIEKGQRYLIAAMPTILHRFPKTRFLLVGDGPLEQQLRRQVSALDLTDRVEFAGFIPHSHIGEQWKRIDIAVVPSIHDTRPVVTLEAMTAGLPLIGTNVGDIPEVAIDGVTAMIVPPKDPPALAKAVIHLLERPKDAVEMGRRGRQRALTDFNTTAFVEQHASMYRRLVSAAFCNTPCDISYGNQRC